MSFIANARMYGVTPAAEAAWRALIGHVADEAGVPLEYVPYPAPAPLEALWARPDLGCVFMCGYPIALGLAPVAVIAAPVPACAWAQGRPLYRTDFIVRRDSPAQTLADTFGGRIGWTVGHSHSGFNAPRHHLLRFASRAAPLYREIKGPLVTARAVLDAVVAGGIDVGPLDAYWGALLARHRPELMADIRVVNSTALAPIPALVASSAMDGGAVTALRAAFAAAASRPWFSELALQLDLAGFAPASAADYAVSLDWARQAEAAGRLTIA